MHADATPDLPPAYTRAYSQADVRTFIVWPHSRDQSAFPFAYLFIFAYL